MSRPDDVMARISKIVRSSMGNRYRQTPYEAAIKTRHVPTGTGDSADLYPEEDAHDDGPPCGVGRIPAKLATARPPGLGPSDLETATANLASLMAARTAPPEVTTAIATNRTPDDRIEHDGTRWVGSIDVPTKLHGILIGTKHATRKEMEEATRCRIAFPEKEAKSSTIRVTSSEGSENVSRCLDRIEATVLSREKTGAIRKTTTHFAAFPCNKLYIQQNFVDFKYMARETADSSCADPVLYPDETKLHMTLCMLQVQTDEEKRLLAAVIAVLQERHKKSFPMWVSMRGLDIMNDDPAQTHVLFAKVRGEGLQEIVDDMRNELLKAGLVSQGEKDAGVKMHVTVMNSRYACRDENGYFSTNWRDRKPFDTTFLLEEHPDYDFGRFKLDRLTICILQSEDHNTGYYKCYMDEQLGPFEM